MPTTREREYYSMGYRDGVKAAEATLPPSLGTYPPAPALFEQLASPKLRKRKLSAWNKFVKANSKKKIYKFANGKLKLKKMGIAFRKKRK
jgi:hypothetical protein